MKIKLLFVTVIFLSISTSMLSQHRRGTQVKFKESGKSDNKQSIENSTRIIELGATYNYQFGGKIHAFHNGRYKEFRVDDSESYTITASVPTKWNTRIELSFFNQNSKISGGNNFGEEYLAIRYYQVGVIKEMPKGDIIPYGAFSVGAVELNPDGSRYDNIWKFALTLGGGLKYYITKSVGIKIEGRLMAPITYGGLYFGTGGSGVGASSYTVQGYIGGGVTFALTK